MGTLLFGARWPCSLADSPRRAPMPGQLLEGRQGCAGRRGAIGRWGRGRGWGAVCSQTEVQAEATVPLLSTAPTLPAGAGATTWITQVPSSRGLLETPPLPTCGPTQATSSDFFHTNRLPCCKLS